jgi:hypothetical protein
MYSKPDSDVDPRINSFARGVSVEPLDDTRINPSRFLLGTRCESNRADSFPVCMLKYLLNATSAVI